MTCNVTRAFEGPADDSRLPALEAVLAGTLALMTSHAEAGSAGRRLAIRARIVSNIDLLMRDERLSTAFRLSLGQLCVHWKYMGAPGSDLAPQRLDGHGESLAMH